MQVKLPPLEFTDCLTDSPYFRDNLHQHEKEIDHTSLQIKRLIKEVKDLLFAAKRKFIILTFLFKENLTPQCRKGVKKIKIFKILVDERSYFSIIPLNIRN